MINCKNASISRIQGALYKWQKVNFPQYCEGLEVDIVDHLKFGVIEEIGELFHAVLKDAQGIRGTHAEHIAAMKDAIGDALVYMSQWYSAIDESLELNTVGFTNSALTHHAAAAIQALEDDDWESAINNVEWLAQILELDSEQCFRTAAEQVLARDWITYPETGKPALDGREVKP
jgi:NTP pyrophosphatase (non-canonical NTP hydrolase)